MPHSAHAARCRAIFIYFPLFLIFSCLRHFPDACCCRHSARASARIALRRIRSLCRFCRHLPFSPPRHFRQLRCAPTRAITQPARRADADVARPPSRRHARCRCASAAASRSRCERRPRDVLFSRSKRSRNAMRRAPPPLLPRTPDAMRTPSRGAFEFAIAMPSSAVPVRHAPPRRY